MTALHHVAQALLAHHATLVDSLSGDDQQRAAGLAVDFLGLGIEPHGVQDQALDRVRLALMASAPSRNLQSLVVMDRIRPCASGGLAIRTLQALKSDTPLAACLGAIWLAVAERRQIHHPPPWNTA